MFTSAHMCIFALVLGCVCAHLLNSSSACPFYICCQTKYTHSPPFCQWFCAAHHLCAASPVALNICGRFIIWWSEPCSLAGCLVGCQLVCLRKQHVYATHSANVYARFHILFFFLVFFLCGWNIFVNVLRCLYICLLLFAGRVFACYECPFLSPLCLMLMMILLLIMPLA